MPFIERDFPVADIDAIARSESSNRTPIYKMHKWFARRVGSTFRALIAGALSEDNPWDRFYSSAPLRDARGRPFVILDPFMGGGTTLVEGHLLGCKVVGVDINPIAWFITRQELEAVSATAIQVSFDHMAARLDAPLRAYYHTTCVAGHPAEIIYSFWIRKVACEHCGREVPLFTTYTLASPPRKHAVIYCPRCRTVFESPAKVAPACSACGASLARPTCPDDFHYDCPHCEFHGDITTAWLAPTPPTPPAAALIAIEYYCEMCSGNHGGPAGDPCAGGSMGASPDKSPFPAGRHIKVPTAADLALYESAVADFARVRDAFRGVYFPAQAVPWDLMETTRPRNRAFPTWADFFNPRQLLCLSLVLKEILSITDRRVREFFLLVFSNTLNANNMFCIYNTTRTELEPLFKHHYFSPPKAPVENNVWGGKIGRGTFVKLYRLALRGVRFQEHPYAIQLSANSPKGGPPKSARSEVPLEGLRIDGRFASTFTEFQGAADVLLHCGTAERLDFLPDACVDAVISDPPYYDNIMYSEVSEFFYVWLRLALHDAYPAIFGAASSRADREILVNAKVGKDGDFYTRGMEKIFQEASRVLKPDGLLVFVFQHKRPAAWTAMLYALVNASFTVTAAYPTHGESRTGLRAFGLTSNAILVCKKQASGEAGTIGGPAIETQLQAKILAAINSVHGGDPLAKPRPGRSSGNRRKKSMI